MAALPIPSIDLGAASLRVDRLRCDTRNFTWLSEKLRLLTGINLNETPKNLSLMAARLVRVIERRGLSGYDEYCALLEGGGGDVVEEFISALTTNTTMFFREAPHFETLTRLLPEYIRAKRAQGSGELRVWCAASSSGQEPYSIAMTILEAVPGLNDLNLRVLATDIDLDVLTRASKGTYTEAEMADVAPLFRQKYFRRVKTERGDHYTILPSLRKLVTFAPFNLMTASYPFKHGFDVIFCRNVLIYFDRAVATTVTDRLGAALAVGGHLFVGHSEVGIVRPGVLVTQASAVYRRVRP